MLETIVKTDKISREEWLNHRRKGIGGSEAAIIVGLNRFGSPLRLWADKHSIGQEVEETEVMRQGKDFEEYVARRWMEATGKKVRRRNYMFRNTDYPHSIADVDREVVGENAGLECKTTSVYNKSDFENGEIPPTYYVQCQHYMAVMGYDRMYLAVLVLSKAFYHFVIERDDAEISALMEQENNWWEEYVDGDSIPDPDGSEEDGELIRSRFPDSNGDEVFLDVLAPNFEKLAELDAQIKELTTERDAIKQGIMNAMGEASVGSAEGWKATWYQQITNRLDSKALKEKHPDIYRECVKTTATRVFRYKKLK